MRLSLLDTNLKQGAHKRGDPTPYFQGRKFQAISLSSCSQECLDSYFTASARKTLSCILKARWELWGTCTVLFKLRQLHTVCMPVCLYASLLTVHVLCFAVTVAFICSYQCPCPAHVTMSLSVCCSCLACRRCCLSSDLRRLQKWKLHPYLSLTHRKRSMMISHTMFLKKLLNNREDSSHSLRTPTVV